MKEDYHIQKIKKEIKEKNMYCIKMVIMTIHKIKLIDNCLFNNNHQPNNNRDSHYP